MRSGSQDISSSDRGTQLKQLPEVLALGETLVAELGLEQSNDVLGRWMAHHLAGLLQEAKTAGPDHRAAAEGRCFDAVLEVWRHRNCLPNGHRPFEGVERVLDTVAALDPDALRPFYNRIAFNWDDLDETERPSPEEKQALDIVRQFDRIARSVLQHLLARVVEDLPSDTREWVRKAQAAGARGPDVTAIRRLLRLSEDLAAHGRQRQDAHVQALREQLENLERFINTAKVVHLDLAARLAGAEAEGAVADEESRANQAED